MSFVRRGQKRRSVTGYMRMALVTNGSREKRREERIRYRLHAHGIGNEYDSWEEKRRQDSLRITCALGPQRISFVRYQEFASDAIRNNSKICFNGHGFAEAGVAGPCFAQSCLYSCTSISVWLNFYIHGWFFATESSWVAQEVCTCSKTTRVSTKINFIHLDNFYQTW